MSEQTSGSKTSCCGDDIQVCCKPTEKGLVIEVTTSDPEKARTLLAKVRCGDDATGGCCT